MGCRDVVSMSGMSGNQRKTRQKAGFFISMQLGGKGRGAIPGWSDGNGLLIKLFTLEVRGVACIIEVAV